MFHYLKKTNLHPWTFFIIDNQSNHNMFTPSLIIKLINSCWTYSLLWLEYPVIVEQLSESSDLVLSNSASSVKIDDVDEAAMSNSGLSTQWAAHTQRQRVKNKTRETKRNVKCKQIYKPPPMYCIGFLNNMTHKFCFLQS